MGGVKHIRGESMERPQFSENLVERHTLGGVRPVMKASWLESIALSQCITIVARLPGSWKPPGEEIPTSQKYPVPLVRPAPGVAIPDGRGTMVRSYLC